jgi:cyclopropane-fatty-acyl-phospholipid synthase
MMARLDLLETEIADALESAFCDYQGPSFSIRLWDGWHWSSQNANARPSSTLVLRTFRGLEALILRPSEITLGEAFLSKDIDVEGDLFSVFAVAEHIFRSRGGRRQRFIEGMLGLFESIRTFWQTGRLHSRGRDRRGISFHYDQPVAFYEPWLGKSMTYSCGYFSSPTDSLDSAQDRKLDLICRKLRLRPCDRFLDIGCGWGSMVLHAASRYGVFAHGITLSQEQAKFAHDRIEDANQVQSCSVELLDYRDACHLLPSFDKIASIGMFEHVGLKNLPKYFQSVYSMLNPGGVFLNHGIARLQCSRITDTSSFGGVFVPFLRDFLRLRQPRNSSFIDKYVFPDGELVTLSQALEAAESAGFEVRDVEDLREHYEVTLHCWVERLQRSEREVRKQVSELTYRTWLLYMAGSLAAFRRGDIGVYQILLSRPDRGASRLPLTREDWYSGKPVHL